MIVLDLAEGVFESIPGAASDIYPTFAGPVDGIVYLDRSLHPAEVASLSLASGVVTRIDDGSNPAVTADGRFLAYSAGGGAASDEAAIIVRDLESAAERRFESHGPPGSFVTVTDLSWSADGRRLAFLRGQDDPGDQPGATSQRQVRVLDLEQDPNLDSAAAFQPVDPGVSWTLPTFRGRFGTLAVVERSTSEADPSSRVLSVDPKTGDVLARLLDLDQPVRSLDADQSGFHLLYSIEEPKTDPAGGYTLSLYSWSGDDPQLVGRDLTGGVWE